MRHLPTAAHLIDSPSVRPLPVYLATADNAASHHITIDDYHHTAPNLDHDNKIHYEAVDRVRPHDDTDN
ncbi:hypothetical protein [Nocardia suismassiliense]|uniref:hypothetical protein n=1 Tax=Nocardia suismassiliense TaxID=2077092 RepID=UPI000D1D6D17|nr:hypothetical protein [Nocardia suismassiliense]